jgi:glycerate dehydrogenase
VSVARQRGVVVSNVPEYGTDSVAQHTVALLLELCQQVGVLDADVHAGKWASSADFSFWRRAPLEPRGLTVGVIGYGRIGRRVGAIAHALGMNVLACGGRGRGEPAHDRFAWADMDRVFVESDVVTLHCPLTADNRHLVNRDRLRSMNPRPS